MAQQYVNYENEYVRENLYPNGRMYVHSSVYLPNSEIDLRTGMIKPDAPRRGRTQAMRLEYETLEKEMKHLDDALRRQSLKTGLRMSVKAAVLLLAGVLFVLFLLFLSRTGTLAEKQKALQYIQKSIEACAENNDLLDEQILEASKATVICYAAARNLNMVPAESAEAIHLVAVDTRPLEIKPRYSASVESPPQTVDAQATMIPALASAGGGY